MQESDADLTQILSHLAEAQRLGCSRLFFANPLPLPKNAVVLHPHNRFIFTLSGSKRVVFADGGGIRTVVLRPGEVVMGARDAWIEELWDSPHTMVSLVCREDYLRVLHLDCHGRTPEIRCQGDLYYHSRIAPTPALRVAMETVLASGTDTPATRQAFQAVLGFAEEMLQADRTARTLNDEELLWRSAANCMQFRFAEDLARADVARHVGLTPAAVSRLARRYAGMGFSEYLTGIRLEHAMELMKNPNISVKRIAGQCGFRYVSYFLRVFNKRMGCSPGVYRNTRLASPEKSAESRSE